MANFHMAQDQDSEPVTQSNLDAIRVGDHQ